MCSIIIFQTFYFKFSSWWCNPPVLLLQVCEDSLQFPSFLTLQRNQDLGRASGLAQGGLLVQTLAVVLD